jgi:hypothetical protein
MSPVSRGEVPLRDSLGVELLDLLEEGLALD